MNTAHSRKIVDSERFSYEIIVSVVHFPPRHYLMMENFEIFFEIRGSEFISGGDHNSKHTIWGSRLITTKGKEPLKVIRDKNCTFLSVGSPTY
jgi:hypothetical protein